MYITIAEAIKQHKLSADCADKLIDLVATSHTDKLVPNPDLSVGGDWADNFVVKKDVMDGIVAELLVRLSLK